MKRLLLIAAALLSTSALAHDHEREREWHHRWHPAPVYVAPAYGYAYGYQNNCNHHCGTVQSIIPMTVPETVWSYAGPYAGGRYVTVFRVTALMNDGTMRYVDYNQHPGLRVGMPIVFRGGTLFRR